MARNELVPKHLLVKHVLSSEAIIISREIKHARAALYDSQYRAPVTNTFIRVQECQNRLDALLAKREEIRARGEWTVVR